MQQDVDLQSELEESEAEGSFSPLELYQFAVGAAKRHRRLGLWLGATVAVLGVTVALIVPARYQAESRVLAVQSAAVAALANTEGRSQTNPFGGDAELLMQKSNLQWMIKETDLLQRWRTSRSLPFRLKDSLLALVLGPPTDADITKSLVELLKLRMYAMNDSSVFTIRVHWRDPDVAVKIAQVAQAKFFELKKTQELSAINAAIALNEDEIRRQADKIDECLAEVVTLKEKRQAESAANLLQAATEAAKPEPAPVRQLGARRTVAPSKAAAAKRTAEEAPAAPPPKLANQLAEIRQRERDLEGPWQRRLAELKFQLTDIRGTYGPEHPVVLQQEAKIREATPLPPELAELRQHEQQLLSEIASARSESSAAEGASGAAGQHGFSSTGAPRTAKSGPGTVVITEREEDPVLSPAKARLSSAITSYGEMSRRLENSRMQLAASQVALQYRYVVVTEPELPRKPVKPNRPVLVIGVLFAAALVALLSGAIRDLISGRIFEAWQLRKNGLAVLGEVDLSTRAKL